MSRILCAPQSVSLSNGIAVGITVLPPQFLDAQLAGRPPPIHTISVPVEGFQRKRPFASFALLHHPSGAIDVAGGAGYPLGTSAVNRSPTVIRAYPATV